MKPTDFACQRTTLATASPDRRSPLIPSLLGAALGLALLLSGFKAPARAADCFDESGTNPRLQIDTSAGPLTIQLFPDAAPVAVTNLLATLVPQTDAGDSGQLGSVGSAYDAITFNYTRPHIEVRTTAYAAGGQSFSQQIDAETLGLHEQRIDTVGQAMNVVQNELLPAFRSARRGGDTSPQLLRWVEAWFGSYEADFLVGTSRKEINEALGHAYMSGLESRPVMKGSVALKPASTTTASTMLSIALTDLPQRTGKWMVIGQVTEGLELVDSISVAPLHRPRHVRTRSYQSMDPVAVKNIRMECG